MIFNSRLNRKNHVYIGENFSNLIIKFIFGIFKHLKNNLHGIRNK